MGLLARANDLSLFDAHIHYSHDVWADYPAPVAIERLGAAGVMRALVSGSDDDGTQQLYQAAPELIIPALRPPPPTHSALLTQQSADSDVQPR